MAGLSWNSPNLWLRGLEGRNEGKKGEVIYHQSGMELMQNCDLPPPVKVFAGSDKTVISSMDRICSMMGREDGTSDETNMELLRALHLSQTRAREAERKAALIAKERDSISNALLEESLQLLAYRQWVKMLEFQVSKLQSLQTKHQEQWSSVGMGGSTMGEDDNEGGMGGRGVTWIMALAFCLGIAFGCKYLF
ncbi:uncharacterized protein LOC117917398 [Vitis riparia]|uniref:uncharacterized protein LOC117917398 n=1 Tax=Vitis riparia TaxID=96939 RepID=UPI00155B3724|nr:uncharacterized protein LOC117917398 [Vitis riparia]